MKRFTDTCKWDDPWFRSLTGVQKLVFMYVIDRCNNAGFWEIDEDSMAFHTKLKPELISGAWQGLGRGLIHSDGWVWVRRFLRHQKNENLNPDNNAHIQIISLLKEQSERFENAPQFTEFLAPYQPLIRGSGKGKVEDKEGKESAERKPKPELDEILIFVASIELPKTDGEWFFEKCRGSGWMNDGKPIKDWKATIRAWKIAGYMLSQKNGNGKPETPKYRPV